MRVGYARVSTKEQNLARQTRMLNEAGCDTIFREKVSGKSLTGRPELEAAITSMKPGDTLVIAEWDRATRSMYDGINLMVRLHDMGCGVLILDKPHLDTTTTIGRGILALLSAMAQDERERINKRVSDGLRAAKDRGQRLGRKPKLNPEQKVEAIRMVQDGKRLEEVGHIFDVSPSTISRLSL